jgi:hypothetical protein
MLVSICGWAKHAILYEFISLEAVEKYFVDPDEWSRRVVRNLIYVPPSPSLGSAPLAPGIERLARE